MDDLRGQEQVGVGVWTQGGGVEQLEERDRERHK